MSLSLAPLSRSDLLALAPVAIRSHTQERYRGDTLTVLLSDLRQDDASTVQDLYDLVLDVRTISEAHLHAPQRGLEHLAMLTREARFEPLLKRVSILGRGLREEGHAPAVRQSIHDIRGGSLMALIMHLDLVQHDQAEPDDVQRIFLLARDHLKMMRNAIKDLDTQRYQADLAVRDHATDLLEQKWRNVRYTHGVRVHFHSDFHGVVSLRCMEFSALDRVIYNLVNNAALYAADGEVHIHVTAVDEAQDTHLRFAVVNAITPEQVATLEATFGDRLEDLYRGGFTTGGHGIGLRIVGDFVTQGYGHTSLVRALEANLLGIDVADGKFVAWFHWPAIRRPASAQAAK